MSPTPLPNQVNVDAEVPVTTLNQVQSGMSSTGSTTGSWSGNETGTASNSGSGSQILQIQGSGIGENEASTTANTTTGTTNSPSNLAQTIQSLFNPSSNPFAIIVIFILLLVAALIAGTFIFRNKIVEFVNKRFKIKDERLKINEGVSTTQPPAQVTSEPIKNP